MFVTVFIVNAFLKYFYRLFLLVDPRMKKKKTKQQGVVKEEERTRMQAVLTTPEGATVREQIS
jgi:hypothetical protein